ncbi:MAG: DUF192 domain-containing protein [Candidatus Riflebacteria bacterium]|nr:DUF192 domain-containing protein [Candidatus Riflebacteria bacterium]
MAIEQKIPNSIKKCLIFLIVILICNNLSCMAQSSDSPQIGDYVQGTLATQPVKLLIVRTSAEKQKGLMFRTSLEKNEGMLFVYNLPQPMVFWMKNTFIPLDLILFSPDLRIIEIIPDMQPGGKRNDSELPRYYAKNLAQFALEMPAGTTNNWPLKIGDKLDIPLTTLFSNEQ